MAAAWIMHQQSQHLSPALGSSVTENSQHFATPSPVSPWNDVCETSAKIPYWWCVATKIWVVPFWLVVLPGKFSSTNQKHYPDLGIDVSSVWNICSHSIDVTSGGIMKCQLFSQAGAQFCGLFYYILLNFVIIVKFTANFVDMTVSELLVL